MMSPQKLAPTDANYPASLRAVFGELASPDLWYIGNLALLGERAVGFCGSRDATENGIATAADCARQLGAEDTVVVSGYAPGVDMASHVAALENGGCTVIVLPEGMDHFRIKKMIKPFWDDKRVLVLSYFPKNAVWRADRAMDRNKAIVALSGAVIVIEARESGGTLNAGYCALKMNKPLFVAIYNEMNSGREGNQKLINDGAVPLFRSRATGKAQLRDVLDSLNDSSRGQVQAAS